MGSALVHVESALCPIISFEHLASVEKVAWRPAGDSLQRQIRLRRGVGQEGSDWKRIRCCIIQQRGKPITFDAMQIEGEGLSAFRQVDSFRTEPPGPAS